MAQAKVKTKKTTGKNTKVALIIASILVPPVGTIALMAEYGKAKKEAKAKEEHDNEIEQVVENAKKADIIDDTKVTADEES